MGSERRASSVGMPRTPARAWLTVDPVAAAPDDHGAEPAHAARRPVHQCRGAAGPGRVVGSPGVAQREPSCGDRRLRSLARVAAGDGRCRRSTPLDASACAERRQRPCSGARVGERRQRIERQATGPRRGAGEQDDEETPAARTSRASAVAMRQPGGRRVRGDRRRAGRPSPRRPDAPCAAPVSWAAAAGDGVGAAARRPAEAGHAGGLVVVERVAGDGRQVGGQRRQRVDPRRSRRWASRPGAPRSSAVVIRRLTTSPACIAGQRERTRAAVAETSGAAKLVPRTRQKPPVLRADQVGRPARSGRSRAGDRTVPEDVGCLLQAGDRDHAGLAGRVPDVDRGWPAHVAGAGHDDHVAGEGVVERRRQGRAECRRRRATG